MREFEDLKIDNDNNSQILANLFNSDIIDVDRKCHSFTKKPRHQRITERNLLRFYSRRNVCNSSLKNYDKDYGK